MAPPVLPSRRRNPHTGGPTASHSRTTAQGRYRTAGAPQAADLADRRRRPPPSDRARKMQPRQTPTKATSGRLTEKHLRTTDPTRPRTTSQAAPGRRTRPAHGRLTKTAHGRLARAASRRPRRGRLQAAGSESATTDSRCFPHADPQSLASLRKNACERAHQDRLDAR